MVKATRGAPARNHGTGPRIAVVGGGPGGLSATKLLLEAGYRDIVIFEAAERLGGKSFSVVQGGGLHEIGTCYSTLSYRTTDRWMRSLGVRRKRLEGQVMDGAPLMRFVREAPGGSFLGETWRFIGLWRGFQRDVVTRIDEPAVHAAAAEPFSDWLERNDLPRMRRFMLRAITSLGYGRLEDLSTLQAMRWATPRLFISGALAELRMPDIGWQGFWERLAGDFPDVRLLSPVLGVERDEEGVTVTTRTGAERFDQILITTPLDDMSKMMEMDADERFVAEGIEWGAYCTTLCQVDDWFQNHAVEAYSEPLARDNPGELLSARRADPTDARLRRPARYYITGQYAGDLDDETLLERLQFEISAREASFISAPVQRRWKYFPRYRLDAIEAGLLPRMRAIQGRRRTWWSGASFSFESVGNIVAFNEGLVARMRSVL